MWDNYELSFTFGIFKTVNILEYSSSVNVL